ncbi:micrococcal nuclease-like nuclease [Thermobacillus composti KWC4]|uniref:Micrococcal nuclease-like nuclease n=1 Tax=Thermobacillus composti (strain DSM 18247 / JCM 13945 / KWC4) TaxID=717605 RepID=L0EEV9_THECK|nr:thermonuclease family protein [Thermobacillus composti]AGA58322.1 micrococcal nuclease-like nuclease [Thermobacillus composti KWC4]
MSISRISPPAARLAGLIALLLSVLAVAGCAAETAATRPWETVWSDYPELRGKTAEEAVVERVVDGDTFVIREGSRVRLIGVNTPEITGSAEFYGEEAAAYTKRMLTGKTVWMFKDVSETDRYGRLLRFVFIPGDALMFNERLVREGYANAATYPPDVSLADRFREAEREARSEGAGLWGGDGGGKAAGANAAAADEKAGYDDQAAAAAEGGESSGDEAASGARDSESAASCPSPDIKGNINSRGERIYHVPGSRYYDRTIAEVWFCTEEEAEAAGFRAPKNGG